MTYRPRSRRTQVAAAVLAAATLIAAGAVAEPAPAAAFPVRHKVDNPYSGGTGYVNPEWKAKADGEPGGSRISSTSTGVWLDGIASIRGSRSGAKPTMGLRDHLDAALAQGARHIQFVLYNLPGRRCGAYARQELGPTEIERYQREFIDPIAAIQARPKYRKLRIINLIEPDSLSDELTKQGVRWNSTQLCDIMAANGNYHKGIAYALGKLAAIPNAYNYLDGSNYHDVGWPDVRADYVSLLAQVARSAPGGTNSVHGFAVNTAGYAATVEPFIDVTRRMIYSTKWMDWNDFVDQQSFATTLQKELVSAGFSSSIGMVIDTSRNGWGGPKRPTAASTVTGNYGTQLNEYIDASRIDRRLYAWNWCNQSGAGIGERPIADPAPGVDAYVWAKPPGESDGWYLDPDWEFKTPMCDPYYTGATDAARRTGALDGSPDRGEWFKEQFEELMRNAYPPL